MWINWWWIWDDFYCSIQINTIVPTWVDSVLIIINLVNSMVVMMLMIWKMLMKQWYVQVLIEGEDKGKGKDKDWDWCMYLEKKKKKKKIIFWYCLRRSGRCCCYCCCCCCFLIIMILRCGMAYCSLPVLFGA